MALSEYRRGAPAGKLALQPRISWRVPRIAWRSTQDHFRDSSVSRITRASLGEGGTYSPTSTTSFFRAAVSAPEGERINPLRDHGAAPTSPPGGVLRQLFTSARGVGFD